MRKRRRLTHRRSWQRSARISRLHTPRIRAWLKYGMTVSQAYGVSDGEIERIVKKP